MVKAHQQAWIWQDEWFDLTMDDVRKIELETQEYLKKCMALEGNGIELAYDRNDGTKENEENIDPNLNKIGLPVLNSSSSSSSTFGHNILANQSKQQSIDLAAIDKDKEIENDLLLLQYLPVRNQKKKSLSQLSSLSSSSNNNDQSQLQQQSAAIANVVIKRKSLQSPSEMIFFFSNFFHLSQIFAWSN